MQRDRNKAFDKRGLNWASILSGFPRRIKSIEFENQFSRPWKNIEIAKICVKYWKSMEIQNGKEIWSIWEVQYFTEGKALHYLCSVM